VESVVLVRREGVRADASPAAVTKSAKVFPVLLSGGAGTRLWPLSREDAPKHLIPFLGRHTLFEQALSRASDPALFEPPIVVAGAGHRFLIAEQLKGSGVSGARIVLEPVARNTAAAAAIAALFVSETAPRGLVLLMPSDHLIEDEPAFRAAVRRALPAAVAGRIVLFGITPDSPATGYGYIRMGEADAGGARSVAAFVEKPDRATAEAYVQGGKHLWNSGMALARADTLIERFASLEPELLSFARTALEEAARDSNFVQLDQHAYERCRAVSLDYAVLERSEGIAVVPAAFGWRDVGSFASLWEAAERDADGNVEIGNVVTEATKNSYVRSDGPIVATVGVDGLIVVATKDAVLVAPRERDQEIRKIVERLKGKKERRE
jgi:mannose-1-phosphate guanylyltransferase/mannose-1-phosphate guanylyltransferase/mannose-6-phosphate isomerase